MPNEPNTFRADQFTLDHAILENFKGDRIDISALMIGFDMAEDLYQHVIVGSVYMEDALDLQQNFPLIGEEKLHLKFKTDDDATTIEKTVVCHSMHDRQFPRQHLATYRLDFCSPEAFTDRQIRVSKSFVGKTVSDIVQFCFDQLGSDKDLLMPTTAEIQNYIAPRIHPMDVINRMAIRAVHPEFPDGAAFTFFENQDGFNFESLEKLLTGEATEYKIHNKTAVTEGGVTDEFYSLNKYEFIKHYDSLNLLMKGGLGNRVLAFDPITRQFKHHQYDYFGDDFSKTEHIQGRNDEYRLHTSQFPYQPAMDALYRLVPTSVRRIDSAYYKGHTSVNEYPHTLKEKNLPFRKAQINQINDSFLLRVEVPGNSDLKIGGMIKLRLPSHTSNDMETGLDQDKFITGRYLIAALRHVVDREKYVTVMELAKDTYFADHESVDRTRELNLL